MRRLFLLFVIAASFADAGAAGPSILRFDDVRPGMKGTGKTAFTGDTVESFDVEILGTLPNIGPEQNLILGRLDGGPLTDTRVMSGMSGSPIFVDGKLIGAVAYSWPFSKEPLAGITPIEEMMNVASRADREKPRPAGSWLASPETALERLHSEDLRTEFFATGLPSLLPGTSTAFPRSVPLSVSGFGTAGIARIESLLDGTGLRPIQVVGAGSAPLAGGSIEPGSPVGIKLVRGDVDMTATGTVTWVDDDRVLAFGHPLFGLGSVDLPMTAARVEVLLSSLHQSSRITVPLEELGAFRQDRAAGIYGVLGNTPRMIPVRLQLHDGSGERRNFSFDVADDPLLGPLLLYTSLNGILANVERMFGSLTLRLREGSVIRLDGEEQVELDNLFAGPTAPANATGLSAYVLYLLMNNDWATPRIDGVNLLLEYADRPRTAQIQRVTVDRYRARAGESLLASVVVSPYRGASQVLTREIPIPEETPPGRLTIQVGDAMAVTRAERGSETILPRDLPQLIWLINHLRRNDRIYIVASRDDTGVFLGGARLPNLPPSVASVLSRPRTLGNFSVVSQRGILEEEIKTDYAVNGFARVQIEVEAP